MKKEGKLKHLLFSVSVSYMYYLKQKMELFIRLYVVLKGGKTKWKEKNFRKD